MLYFKLISFLLGFSFMAFGAWALWDPKAWRDFLTQKIWIEGNPLVLAAFFFVDLALAMIGWVLSFKIYPHAYGFIVSSLLTLGAIKLGGILPFYKSFRQAVFMLLTTEKFTRFLFLIIALLLGSGLFYLGVVIQ